MNEEKGKCKCEHAERKMAFDGALHETKVLNGWPNVSANEKACGDWKKIPE